jgi:dTDP-4-amino-4,6-dideoxygalactose transaminase
MDSILDLAERHGLLVIEDACQAHGAEYFSRRHRPPGGLWRRAGSIGDAAAFSFYPGKNLGACGEAGAVTTNDDVIAHKVRMLRDHGQARKYHHDLEGFNGRLDAIQAAVLRIKLRHLEHWNTRRRAAALRYNDLLSGTSCVTPFEPDSNRSVYHLYVVRTRDREPLVEHLQTRGVHTGLHYPVPVHLQRCYLSWGCRMASLPVTNRIANEVLSLPMFPGLLAEQQQRVAAAIESYSHCRPQSACPSTDSMDVLVATK